MQTWYHSLAIGRARPSVVPLDLNLQHVTRRRLHATSSRTQGFNQDVIVRSERPEYNLWWRNV